MLVSQAVEPALRSWVQPLTLQASRKASTRRFSQLIGTSTDALQTLSCTCARTANVGLVASSSPRHARKNVKHGSASYRSYATESELYKHSYSGPPPPVPTATVAQVRPRRREPSTSPEPESSSAGSSQADSNVSGDSSQVTSRTSSRTSTPSGIPQDFGANQRITAESEELQAELEAILSQFRAPIRYAFAYGSGVFKQSGYSAAQKPMLDYIFAVSHPSHFHSINVNQHPDHYSLLSRLLGSDVVSFVQQKVGAGVWFNVECVVNGRIIKYGIVSVDTIVRDLLDWDTLYLAGRMHKPLNILRDDPRIRLANQVNLSSAVRTALLLLPETFSEDDLYTEIAGLSYRGDFRMAVGENPRKVRNIVEAQEDLFQRLYRPILKAYHKNISYVGPEGSGSIRQDVNPRARAELARRLPKNLKESVYSIYERGQNISVALNRRSAQEGEVEMSRMEEQALWTSLSCKSDFKLNLETCEQS